jgi:hypothetical protein
VAGEPDLDLIASCSNGEEALQTIERRAVCTASHTTKRAE